MLKEVQSFLGFGNFYRKFINHYSEKAKPLNRLTRKDQPWTWEKEQKKAFADMKRAFVEEVVLAAPNPEEQYFMAMDASKKASGGVLMQRDVNRDMRPISFISSMLNLAKRNYEIYDRELLALI